MMNEGNNQNGEKKMKSNITMYCENVNGHIKEKTFNTLDENAFRFVLSIVRDFMNDPLCKMAYVRDSDMCYISTEG